MKGLAALSLIALASALPQDIGEGSPKPLGKTMIQTIGKLRGKDGKLHGGVGPETRNEITSGSGCGDITFIFARASMEPGNMGGSMGPIICNRLKKTYGSRKVLCQGVGGAYTAGIADNVGRRGTSAAAIREATRMFTMASRKCPKAIIVFGGYSQGTAVMHGTVGALPAAIKSKIVAGVLFGDTRNKQDRGMVPNFPKDKVRIYCTKADGVCWGKLNVTNGHFAYPLNGDAEKAMAFLKGSINAARGGSGGSAGGDEE